MPVSEEHLRRAVDDVLEPVWQRERHRSIRRLACSTLGRVAGFLMALWVLALVERLLVGTGVPWAFFGFMTVLAAVCAVPDVRERAHLRRE